MDAYEKETARNRWVAEQCDVIEVYRDDNCFIDLDDPDGKTLAHFVSHERGEYLMFDGKVVPVPSQLTLGLIYPHM